MADNNEHPRAYERPDFLASAEARGIRMLSEYLEPLQRFNSEQIWHTIVFFGSARFIARDDAVSRLEALRSEEAGEEAIRFAETQVRMSDYYEDARRLSHMLTEWSLGLPEEVRFVTASGGGGGIMEATNRGASEAGGKTVALNIRLPFEQKANQWAQERLTFDFHYFFMRKFWFTYRAKAAVIFPGGFGTLDELMELLTLIQTGRVEKRIPIVIYGSDFWDRVVNLQALSDFGAISPEDLDLFTTCDTPEDAFDTIVRAFTLTDSAQ